MKSGCGSTELRLPVARELAPLLDQLNYVVALDGQSRASCDVAMSQLAMEEKTELLSQLEPIAERVYQQCRVRYLASNPLNTVSRCWTLEALGRAGGVEAGLFASELIGMYMAYGQNVRHWDVQVLTEEDPQSVGSAGSSDGCGGGKLRIEGDDVYLYLKHEIGVHRVQRVPSTEKSGRMQTSTASVVLMPIVDPVTVAVKESDCEIEMVRGSGPGGQAVNTSSNCVRLFHRPSHISIKCHSSRSGTANRQLALEMLAQQLWKEQYRKQTKEVDKLFLSQWTEGERGERMRTYNQPQNRVTDHRLKVDISNIAEFLRSAKGLERLHDLLITEEIRTTSEATLKSVMDREFAVVP